MIIFIAQKRYSILAISLLLFLMADAINPNAIASIITESKSSLILNNLPYLFFSDGSNWTDIAINATAKCWYVYATCYVSTTAGGEQYEVFIPIGRSLHTSSFDIIFNANSVTRQSSHFAQYSYINMCICGIVNI